MSAATKIIDPDMFAVPAAKGDDGQVHHVKHGKPVGVKLSCMFCGGGVHFVKEVDEGKRAAHFSHNPGEGAKCRGMQEEMMRDMHREFVEQAAAMFASAAYDNRDLCRGLDRDMNVATGEVLVERNVTHGDKTYRPDITVMPREDAGKWQATLELEIEWTHAPEDERIRAAMQKGHLVGLLKLTQDDRIAFTEIRMNRALLVPWIIETIQNKKFAILGKKQHMRAMRGKMALEYRRATVLAKDCGRSEGPSVRRARALTAAEPRPGIRVNITHPELTPRPPQAEIDRRQTAIMAKPDQGRIVADCLMTLAAIREGRAPVWHAECYPLDVREKANFKAAQAVKQAVKQAPILLHSNHHKRKF